LSGHPLTRFEQILNQYTTADAIRIKEAPDGATVRIGGLVRGMKTIKTRKGDLMGFATIEDRHGAIEVTVFSRVFAAAGDLLIEDRGVLVQGQVQRDEQSVKLIAETIIPLEKAEEVWTASVHLRLDLDRSDRALLLQLRDVLQRYPGGCKAYLHFHAETGVAAMIELSEGFRLKAGPALSRDVAALLGQAAVETRCTSV